MLYLSIFLIGGLIGLINLWLYDKLIRWEYTYYKGNWKQDGSPTGVFWTPPELKPPDLLAIIKGLSSMFYYQDSDYWKWRRSERTSRHLMFDWLFITPVWARGDWKARLLLYLWRGAVLLGIGYIPMLVLIVEYMY